MKVPTKVKLFGRLKTPVMRGQDIRVIDAETNEEFAASQIIVVGFSVDDEVAAKMTYIDFEATPAPEEAVVEKTVDVHVVSIDIQPLKKVGG